MIKTKLGDVTITGPRIEILADVSCIVKALVTESDITKNEINYAVERAFWTDEEIAQKKAEVNELLKDSLEEAFKEMMAEMFGEKET